MVDGRHRFRAAKKNGTTVRGYAGFVPSMALLDQAMDTYHQQRHSGSSPQNKSFTSGNLADGSAHGLVPLTVEGQRRAPLDESSLPSPPPGRPYCAGLAVRAADTGRMLMLQRLASESDDGAGMLEWPGGHAEDGETMLAAAMREFSEEVGVAVPIGQVTGHWESSNGVYEGFVLSVPHESDVDLGSRDLSANPDGDGFCAAIWMDPAALGGNRAVRQEVLTDLPLLQAALNGNIAKSAQTPIVSTVHHPLGHEGLWHTPDRHVSAVQQLPAYFQNTARALMRDQGMPEHQAIPTAINAVDEWRHGTAFGGRVKVTPEVQAAAERAWREWEDLKASHHD
jgi:8-oxo-dGTP pyrophosphatase MutT (NUDIX family)